MDNRVLDYKASVPSSMFGGTAPQLIPQVPSQLQVADLGMFLSELTTDAANNRVYLSADVGVRVAAGTLFNNALIFRIYRDGQEVFNTTAGLQRPLPPATTETPTYNFTFNTIDEGVPFGFHVYQLTVQALITNVPPSPFVTFAEVVGPVTFSGLAIGTDN